MKKKSVLITGASRGLGKALALRFAKAGWQVAATMLDVDETPELQSVPGIRVSRLDVSDTSSIDQGVSEVMEHFGSLDMLINNAGYGSFAVVESTTEEQIRKLYVTNALGPVFVSRAILPYMRRQGSGLLIFVSSSIASLSAPFHGLYGACKWATTGFAEALVYETKGLGIQIKIMAPGAMATSYFEHTDDRLDHVPAEYERAIASHRAGLPQALAGAPSPEVVAQEIYEAATDNTPRVHYLVTDQARKMVGYRREIGDESWLKEALGAFLNNTTVAQVGDVASKSQG